MKNTKAYIFKLDPSNYPCLEEEIASNNYLKDIFSKYELQLTAILHDEVTTVPNMNCYCLYLGLALNHNQMELGFTYFPNSACLEAFIENNTCFYLSQSTIKKFTALLKNESQPFAYGLV